jgi:transcriptional regulator NrdR family protein
MSRRKSFLNKTLGIHCIACGSQDHRVVYTRPRQGESVQRRRECRSCGERFTTWERTIGVPNAGIASLKSRQ